MKHREPKPGSWECWCGERRPHRHGAFGPRNRKMIGCPCSACRTRRRDREHVSRYGRERWQGHEAAAWYFNAPALHAICDLTDQAEA